MKAAAQQISQPDPCPDCHYRHPQYRSVCQRCRQEQEPASPKRRNKFGAKRTEHNGVVYDSRKEARRAAELELLQGQGLIRNLRRQVTFPLEINGVDLGSYRADFCYLEPQTCGTVIEDVKGVRTPTYRLKKKLVEAIYGIEIREK